MLMIKNVEKHKKLRRMFLLHNYFLVSDIFFCIFKDTNKILDTNKLKDKNEKHSSVFLEKVYRCALHDLTYSFT